MAVLTPAITLDKFTTFGDLLKYLRRRAGLTQRELSIAVGYSDAQISRLEQNQRPPDLATLTARFVPALGLEDEPKVVARFLELAEIARRAVTPAQGQEIRGYELRERIGAGGFGEVYRAYQPSVGREVAVKVILPQHANHPDFIRRFETEAQLVARLEHPHIVPLYDYWREPDGAYLVMRWLRSGSLRGALAERGPWAVEAAARLLDHIAGALAAAHRQGVVHRDIKPENILLDEEGNAYLSDFGIAQDVAQATGLTEAEGVSGSLAYISPEQAQSKPVTAQSDLYSLGVVLYEVLTGEHPFPGVAPTTQLLKHLSEPLPLLRERRPELP